MADETRGPSGVIENTAIIGLAAAIGTAIAADVQSPEWRNVIHIGAPIAGKLVQMLLAALVGDTLGGAVVSAAKRVSGGGAAILAAIALGLAAGPASAQEQPEPPTFGVNANGASIYAFRYGWPRPTVEVNAVEFIVVEAQADLDETWGRVGFRPLGGICLIPRVGPALGPVCEPIGIGG